MKVLLIFVWLLVFAFFGLELGYTATSPGWTHLTYSFQHASFIHLILNCIGFYYMTKALENRYRPVLLVGVAYLISVGVSFLVYYDKPVVGASGLVYALIGMFAWVVLTNLPRLSGKARQNNILFLSVVSVSLLISLFNPHSAGLIHLLCMVAGGAFLSAWHFITKTN